MKLLAYVRSVVGKLSRSSEIAEDTEEELHSHVQMRADDLERSGMSRADAERRARIEFGGHERFRVESYEALGGNFIETFLQDIRFSLRLLQKSPGFTVVAVLTLALAIGANAVVFAVLNGLIIRPLDLPEAPSLYAIERGSDRAINHSFPDYRDLRDRNRSFEGLTAYNVADVSLDTGKDPAYVWSFEVTGNYFDVLKIHPYLGRFFHASDEHGLNSAPYIVLTYAYWHTHFHDDPRVVGRIVQVNRHPFTVLGVGPRGFQGTLLFVAPDVWLPIVDQDLIEGGSSLDNRSIRNVLMVMGHLKPGVSPGQAIADLNAIGAWLQKNYPKDDGQMTYSLTRPYLAGDWLGKPVRDFLAALMLLSGLILLAACANLGSLFAARAADRGREIALRLALGSSRRRIVRQVFTEAVLISLIGGVVGLAATLMLLRGMSVWHPMPNIPILHLPVTPDANVFWVALGLALASGFLFGAVPVRQVFRTNPYEIVKAGSSGKAGRRISVRDLLVVTQIAICAVLVTSSIVAVRGLDKSLHSNFGFEPRNAMLVETHILMAGYSGDKGPQMQKRMIETLQAIPGVSAVALVDRPQLYYGANDQSVYSDKTTDLISSNMAAQPMVYRISPGYFDAARTALLAGRTFTWHDDKNALRVAVVNRQFAVKMFGSVPQAVGGYFKVDDGSRIQVVGVVENGKYSTLTEDTEPAMFLPFMQHAPLNETTMIVRSSRDPQQLTVAITDAMRKLDDGLPFTMQTWNQELNGALFASRMATMALGVLGTMGAILSITGIFGMAAYSVSKRLREIGIRMALGAQRGEVLQAALGRALRLLALGSAVGLVLGILASKVLAYIVYQATPRDPLVLGGVVLIMLLLGLVATWIPAQRALSVNPLILLREE